MSGRRLPTWLLAAGLALALGEPLRAQGASPAPGAAPLDARDAERESALAALRAEASALERRLAEISRRVGTVSDEVDRLGVALASSERRTAEARLAKALAEDRLARAEAEARELAASIEATRRRMARSLFDLDRRSRRRDGDWIPALLREQRPLAALRWLRFAAARDARRTGELAAAASALAERRSRVAVEREAASRWLAEETRRRREVEALYRRQARLLEEFLAEHQRVGHRTVDLRDRERRLEALLAVVASADADRELAGRPITEFRGALDWPAAGRIAIGFGPRLDPRYRTRVPHSGIDLEVRAGSPVTAVYPGEVLYAGQFEGYGNLVVVRHAGRVLTLYAGLRAARVMRRDVVGFRAVIGESAESLYFELRADGRAENPAAWLREQRPTSTP